MKLQKHRSRRLWIAGIASLLGATLVCAYLVGRARAAGAPTMQPLTYSGVLTDTAGAPLTGTKNIQVSLWDMAADGTQRCSAGPTATPLNAGAFQIVLPAACATAVHGGGDLWIEVFVDGTSLGRTKIGAVPYAIEADHAVAADQASGNFQVANTLTATNAGVSGTFIRKIARSGGNGPGDDTDNGNLVSRTLTFTKTQAATGVPVSYNDNLRVANGGACRWEIIFNGASCPMPAGGLVYDVYFGGVAGMNHHRPEALFGTCMGLAAGSYNIQIRVGAVASGSGQPIGDCYTGWFAATWQLEAEEVF